MDRDIFKRTFRHVVLLAAGLLGFSIFATGVVAKRSPDAPVVPHRAASTVPNSDPYLELVPEAGAPVNGGTVEVGDRFVLGLWLNAGSHTNLIAQESYMIFTSDYLKNARVDQITTTCALTSTVTADASTFDAELQNEVCNGMGPGGDDPCFVRGMEFVPGSFAFASGAWDICPAGCGGYFRVARIGLCAVAPGVARFRWQFSPPDPPIRGTDIVDIDNNEFHDATLFSEYVIHVASTVTPTVTTTLLLRGHVFWQGRPTQPNTRQQAPITLTLKMGSIETNYAIQTTDARGYFTATVTGLPPGVYNWRAKGPNYLANSGTVTLSGGQITTVEMGSMMPGDADNNNIVNGGDFGILRTTFAKTLGDPGYDWRADFNGDNVVNSVDLSIMRSNFGSLGVPPIGPWSP